MRNSKAFGKIIGILHIVLFSAIHDKMKIFAQG
jgi:hypothetical protein